MTANHERALESWLAQQPIGDELNEVIAPVALTATPEQSNAVKELSHD